MFPRWMICLAGRRVPIALAVVPASIRVYAPADDENAIKTNTQDIALSLITNKGLDVQVLLYDIATSLQPDTA